MRYIKTVNQSRPEMMLHQCHWLIEKTVEFSRLRICESAVILAPEGKKVTLIVNGVVREMKPGLYTGRVVLYVSELYVARPEGLMVFNEVYNPMAPALCVETGAVTEAKSIPAAIQGGTYDEKQADGLYIGASSSFFNGLILDSSDYVLKNSRFDFEGQGRNDFAGCDSGVMAVGSSHVDIENCVFNFSGVTRCAIHVSGDAEVSVKNSDIVNIVPDTGWIGRFCWVLPLRGSNRLCQLAGNGKVVYDHCRIKSNGWGVLSIDGSDEFVSLTVKNSELMLSGPDSYGYGTFCIGPNEVILDHSVVDVNGFPMLIMGMEGKGRPIIQNGCLLTGRSFGAMLVGDDNSTFRVSDSTFRTRRACIVSKESASTIELKNCTMESEAGVLLQLMDTDECGMDVVKFYVPVGKTDTYIEGRDLTAIDPALDTTLRLQDMTVCGDVYNSTTNLRAYLTAERDGMGDFHDRSVGPVAFNGDNNADSDAITEDIPQPKDQRGPKNLAVELRNARLTGVISSALQFYPDGVTEITPDNWQDISNIRQEAAAPVNNGVIVSLDGNSAWTVAGESFLTKLTLDPGAVLQAIEGKTLRMTVNGSDTAAAPGCYTGVIHLSAE